MSEWKVSIGRPANKSVHTYKIDKGQAKKVRAGEVITVQCSCGGVWELDELGNKGHKRHYFLVARNGKCLGLIPDLLFKEHEKGEEVCVECSCGYLLLVDGDKVTDHYHKRAIRFEKYMGAWYPEHVPPEVNESWERYQRAKGETNKLETAMRNSPGYRKAEDDFNRRMVEAEREIEKRKAKFRKRAAEDPLFAPGRTKI